MDLVVAILALILGAAALAVLDHRYRLIRRRLGMLANAADTAARVHRTLYGRLATATLARQGRTPRMPIEFTSEFGEDIALYELFGGRAEGFFIEVGAHDGHEASVSYPFEAMGWTGLLVEPVERTFVLCKQRRAASTVLRAVLTRRDAGPTVRFAEVHTGGGTGVAARSYVVSAGPAKEATRKDQAAIKDVPAMTMDQALERAGATRVDFAAIDVEGHEMDLLDGFDTDRWRPRAIMIEEYPPGQRPELIGELERRGYRAVHTVGWNRLMVRADDHELIERCRQLQWLRG